MRRLALKKQAKRREREAHTFYQRWRDDHRRSYPFPRRKRWRNMPAQVFEYRLTGYGQIVCPEPGEIARV